jgi:hypothetical protein
MKVKLTEIQIPEPIRFGAVVGEEKWGDKSVRTVEDGKLSTNVKSLSLPYEMAGRLQFQVSSFKPNTDPSIVNRKGEIELYFIRERIIGLTIEMEYSKLEATLLGKPS